MSKTVDSVQARICEYACGLKYENIPPEAIHAAKIRLIYILGSLIGGFFGEPSRIVRNLAAQMPDLNGATIIGTRMKTSPDMAAMVNSTAARYLEMIDMYHWPGSYESHAIETVMPILAVAEYARSSGRELLVSIVLSYEIYLRIADVFHNRNFDHTMFCCIASAVASGKLLKLSASELAHCISMAVVPNAILRQVRLGHLSMFKVVATGCAGRAGVFAALLAQAGMEGPHLPFEGKAGWCDQVAGERFSMGAMGGDGASFKILDTYLKNRPCCATSISSVMAAEKIAPLVNTKEISKITVEAYKRVKDFGGTGEQYWNPASRDTADHSVPYAVAVTLMDGTVNPGSFDDAHLWNPDLRALLRKVEVVENDEFTHAYERLPVEHHTRVTVVMNNGESLVGQSGGTNGDLAYQRTQAQISEEFHGLTDGVLGEQRVESILTSFWQIEDAADIVGIPPLFALA